MIGAILFSPLSGLAFVCKEIANAVEKSLEVEKGELMSELRALHSQVERKEIEEAAFAERETALLDRLDVVTARIGR
jgi:hypothetical protein